VAVDWTLVLEGHQICPGIIVERPKDHDRKRDTSAAERRNSLGNDRTVRSRSYVQEMGGQKVSRGAAGTLWHCAIEDGSDRYVFAVVEVVNGSKEPDGSRKRYFLSVPADCRSTMEAVAWTYSITVKQYRQLKVHT
jgi:hypothetical protein